METIWLIFILLAVIIGLCLVFVLSYIDYKHTQSIREIHKVYIDFIEYMYKVDCIKRNEGRDVKE